MKISQRASVIGLAVLLALSLIFVVAVKADAAQDELFYITSGYSDAYYIVYNLVDNETGVNYIMMTRRGKTAYVTPRLNADGSLYVSK